MEASSPSGEKVRLSINLGQVLHERGDHRGALDALTTAAIEAQTTLARLLRRLLTARSGPKSEDLLDLRNVARLKRASTRGPVPCGRRGTAVPCGLVDVTSVAGDV